MARPIASQPKNRIQVSIGRLSIRAHAHHDAQNREKRHQRNAERPRRLGSVLRRMITPMQTRANAKSVPIFVRSASEPISVNIATPPTDHAGPDGGDVRRAESWMNPGEILRQQTIARHGHENARLAELENEKDRSHARRAPRR